MARSPLFQIGPAVKSGYRGIELVQFTPLKAINSDRLATKTGIVCLAQGCYLNKPFRSLPPRAFFGKGPKVAFVPFKQSVLGDFNFACRSEEEDLEDVLGDEARKLQKFQKGELIVHKEKSLGMGAFGSVYKATVAAGTYQGLEVVLKAMKLVERAHRQAEVELYVNELLSGGECDHIAQFLGYYRHDGKFWLVWKFEGQNTLQHYWDAANCLDALESKMALWGNAGATGLSDMERRNRLVKSITIHLLRALEYTHRHHIVHRDMKPANVILGSDGQLKLIDFGCGVDTTNEMGYKRSENPGTPEYAAPEFTIHPAAPCAYDVFGAGLIILQAAYPKLRSTKELSFFRQQLTSTAAGDLDVWLQRRVKGHNIDARLRDALALLNFEDGAAWDLLRRLLHPNPRARITAQQALQHVYVRDATSLIDNQPLNPHLAPHLDLALRTSLDGWWRTPPQTPQLARRRQATLSSNQRELTPFKSPPRRPASSPVSPSSPLIAAPPSALHPPLNSRPNPLNRRPPHPSSNRPTLMRSIWGDAEHESPQAPPP